MLKDGIVRKPSMSQYLPTSWSKSGRCHNYSSSSMSAYSTCSSGEGEVFSSSSSESEENETEIIEEEGESKLTLSKCVCRVLELIVKPKPIIKLLLSIKENWRPLISFIQPCFLLLKLGLPVASCGWSLVYSVIASFSFHLNLKSYDALNVFFLKLLCQLRFVQYYVQLSQFSFLNIEWKF